MFNLNIRSQDKLVLKGFNIIEAASGEDKVFIHTSKAVVVSNNTLEIRFYWAGKGTTTSPRKGVYGPLISAIDVESGEFLRWRIVLSAKVLLEYLMWTMRILIYHRQI